MVRGRGIERTIRIHVKRMNFLYMNRGRPMFSLEFKKFDKAIHQILSISRNELRIREEKWKKERKRRKRKPKTPASDHASRVKD
jgi:hypothetical protein